MMLKGKIAVVYGAGGAIGGAVARAFAAEGAQVFATGRTKIAGLDQAAVVDALDEKAIEKHLRSVIDKAGRIDISFNAIGIADRKIIGIPLMELDADTFTLPITDYAKSYFLTARAAARHMVPNKSGVIMTVSALPSRTGTTLNGGYGPAMAAKEALTRDLSVELAPHGIRVLSLRPHGIPETHTMKSLHRLKAAKLTFDQFEGYIAGMSHSKRVMTLDEVANVAAFVASDKASGLLGITVNMTMGNLSD